MKRLITACVLMLMTALTVSADRYTTLAGAKHLAITTADGTTYYYIVANQMPTALRLDNGQLSIGSFTLAAADVKSIRVKNIEQYILDEDSTTFNSDYTVEGGLLVLRRTMTQGQWNSLVLPVSLTVEQVRGAFGDDVAVATITGLRQNEQTAIDLTTITPGDDGDILIEANKHYLVNPSREADVQAGRRGALLKAKPMGPFYLIPGVTQGKSKRQPDITSLRSEDNTVSVMVRGTFTNRNGSSLSNRKLYGGYNPIYMVDEEGLIAHYNDSVAAKAFTSWFSDMSPKAQQLTFYIDGVTANATQIAQMPMGPKTDDDAVYDLQGRRVACQAADVRLRPGLYVVGGKKIIIKH